MFQFNWMISWGYHTNYKMVSILIATYSYKREFSLCYRKKNLKRNIVYWIWYKTTNVIHHLDFKSLCYLNSPFVCWCVKNQPTHSTSSLLLCDKGLITTPCVFKCFSLTGFISKHFTFIKKLSSYCCDTWISFHFREILNKILPLKKSEIHCCSKST
jgi:hypothetical protein